MDIINKTVGVFYNLFKTKKKVIYCVYEQAMKRMGLWKSATSDFVQI